MPWGRIRAQRCKLGGSKRAPSKPITVFSFLFEFSVRTGDLQLGGPNWLDPVALSPRFALNIFSRAQRSRRRALFAIVGVCGAGNERGAKHGEPVFWPLKSFPTPFPVGAEAPLFRMFDPAPLSFFLCFAHVVFLLQLMLAAAETPARTQRRSSFFLLLLL